MDFTSRKLVRRARIRRNHERQVRVAAVKSRKRTSLQPGNDPLEQLLIDQQEAELAMGGLLDEISNSTHSTQSTIPSLPSLSGSQCLTASSTTSRRTGTKGLNTNFKNADISSSSAAPPNVSTTPYPGHVKGAGPAGLGGLSGAMAVSVTGKQRQKRVRGTKRSDPFNDRVSDSNIPTETSSRHRRSGGKLHCKAEDASYCDQGSNHFSDSAVSAQHCQQQQHQELQEDSDLTVQSSRRKHGRVRPQGADIKRKRARQLEELKPYYNSKIETVLEEEIPSEEQRKDSATNDKNIKQKEKLATATSTKDETKRQQPVIADVLPSNPPSPALSQMVRQKTESLNISETTLQQIKEMNSHLRIVNWLWDSTQLPLAGGASRRKARSCRGTSPGAATTVTTHSDNLVVVRKGAGANWFDLPRVNHHQEAAVCRQDQMSPVSVNSDFKSDYEDELMSLV